MAKFRLAGAAVIAGAALVSGCAWVLPKPSAANTGLGASGTGTACQLDQSEARRNVIDHVTAIGIPSPAAILRTDGRASDRTIRNGDRITLRAFTLADGNHASLGAETATLTVASVGGVGSDPVEIRGDSVVLLQAHDERPTVAAAQKGESDSSSSPTSDEFVIYKADVADPNRPTTCDNILRDGDLVYLRTVVPSAWVEVRDRALQRESQPIRPEAMCRASEQHCYTDRYGGLVCARLANCAASIRH
jgi:hypothetical protein